MLPSYPHFKGLLICYFYPYLAYLFSPDRKNTLSIGLLSIYYSNLLREARYLFFPIYRAMKKVVAILWKIY